MEQLHRIESDQLERVVAAEQYVGYTFVTSGDEPYVTPERLAIMEAAETKVEEMRQSLAVAVKSLGMEVSEEQLNAWNPEPGQVIKLQHELRHERRRARMLDGLRAYLQDPEKMDKFRDHQKEALHKLGRFVEETEREEDGSKRGYVDMATGTGKTGVITGFVDGLKHFEDPADPTRIVILSPTQQITKQTIGLPMTDQDEPKGFAKFTPELEPTSYYQYDHTISPLTVMTNASFGNLMKQALMPETDVVIIDETHTVLGEQISEFIRRYAPNKLVVGFTATPDYSTDKTSASLLKNRIHSLPLPEAVRRGILAPFEAELRPLHVDVPDKDASGLETREYNLAVEKAYFDARLEDALPDIVAAVQKGEGVLVRCPPGGDVWFARRVEELLREKDSMGRNKPPFDIRALALGGSDQSLHKRQRFVELFNAGKIGVFAYVKSINMGTDVPRAKLLVNLKPESKIVDITQAAGRVGRYWEDARGTSVKAKCIDYTDPRLGDAQFTVIDVLNGRTPQAGEDLVWEVTGELEGIDFNSVSELDFNSSLGAVTRFELGKDPEHTNRRYSITEAAGYFDIGLPYLRQYLESVGIVDDEIGQSDIATLEDLFPELRIPFASKDYVTTRQLKKELGVRGTHMNFEHQLTEQNVITTRMRDGEGTVRTYVLRKDVRQ